MANRFGPGCNCCGCAIMQDDFADDSIDSEKWTVDSGNWSESSGEILTTSGGPGQTLLTVAEVTNNAGIRAVVHGSGTPQFLLHWEDSDNHVTGEITPSTWAVRIRKKTAGVYSTLATGTIATAQSNDTWSFCQSDVGVYQLRNVTRNDDIFTATAQDIPGSPLPAGLGVLNSGTAARFGATAYLYNDTGEEAYCPTCNACCDMCTTATCIEHPETLTATLPDIPWDTPCTSPTLRCQVNGGTFGLTREGACTYRWQDLSVTSGIREVFVDLGSDGFGNPNTCHFIYHNGCSGSPTTATFNMGSFVGGLDCSAIDVTRPITDTNPPFIFYRCYQGQSITVEA